MIMKKIILAVGQLFGGGAERVVSIWSSKLSNAGYDVSILICGRGENEYQISRNVKILSIASEYNEFQKMSYIKRYFSYRSILKKEKPDVVISFLPTTQIWCNLASIGLKFKRIETVRNNPWYSFQKNRISKFLWRRCFNKANRIIVQTNEQIEFFSKKNQKKCVVISNPLTPKIIDNEPKKLSNKICNFIASGRLNPQKNYPLMIEAFRIAHENYPSIKLNIFGKGNEQYVQELEKIIKEKKLENVVFLKGYSSEVLKEYENADAFLMTSDYEGLPNSLIEAMASKLICISTDCKTGPKDLIDDGVSGFLAKTGDAKSICDCIISAINLSPTQIENMGNNARKKIIDFCSDEKSFKALLEVIEN